MGMDRLGPHISSGLGCVFFSGLAVRPRTYANVRGFFTSRWNRSAKTGANDERQPTTVEIHCLWYLTASERAEDPPVTEPNRFNVVAATGYVSVADGFLGGETGDTRHDRVAGDPRYGAALCGTMG